MDNFDRHVYFTLGVATGIGVTVLFGWPVGLGFLIGNGGGGFILYGLVTGRIELHRKRSHSRIAE